MIDTRLAICALLSVAAHFVFAKSLGYLPARAPFVEHKTVQVHVVAPPPPPPPEPEPPPEPKPEPPKPIVHEKPQPKQVVAAKQETKPVDTPTDHPPITTDTTTEPIRGITMESTSQGGTGPALPVGNTTSPAAPVGNGSATKPLAEPAAAAEVTKMPLPQGRCSGKYTDEARAAAVEGVVVLDLIVDETGHTRDITVVDGLPHGLTEAAIAALRGCRFSPGEKGGSPVPVRIRGFKIRFVLQEGE